MRTLSTQFRLRAAPHRVKSQTLEWVNCSLLLRQEILVVGAVYRGELDLLFRGGTSTRFHPKRRASTDHKPGPNIARAPPMVPSRRATHRSPAGARICQISIKATNVPATGVHSPGIRRIPHPAKNTDITVVFIGGSFHSIELARTISAEPTTKRMRSKPMPGQPPANVEYRRRNTHPSNHY